MRTRMKTTCFNCEKGLNGRLGKKFCSDRCRSAYNNALKSGKIKSAKAAVTKLQAKDITRIRKEYNTLHTRNRKCPECSKAIEGRSDKKYCSDACRNAANNKNKYTQNLWRVTRARALKNNIPFNITPQDIQVPSKCPLLGIPIQRADGYQNNNSPSIDKFFPEKGYTKGNVWIISAKANRIKSDLNKEELKLLCTNVLKQIKLRENM